MAETRVFADTNVILEAFRIGCWAALSHQFAIETVEKCVEETLTGNPDDPRHILVPHADLTSGLDRQYPVTSREIASLLLAHPSCSVLDDGEKHLLAWLFANKLLLSSAIVVTTADKAALVATHRLGWLDCTVSMEYLAHKVGVGRVKLDALALQYRENWLSGIKTKIKLGIIP